MILPISTLDCSVADIIHPSARFTTLWYTHNDDQHSMTDANVVIIGGGVMGVSLLFHLTEAGWKDVVLLEKNDLTHGSTWHAAGLCTHFAHNPTIQELRARSVRLYRDELPERTGQTCGFHACGAMRITRNPDRLDEFRHVAGLSSFTGYDLEVLDVGRITELHPLAKTDGLIGGIYEPEDGHVDPTLATQAMASLASSNGGIIRRYEPVQGIHREAGHWLVDSSKDTYRANHVINASGTWCWEVGHMMGLNLPVVPVLHQYLVTEGVPAIKDRIDGEQRELPIIRDPEESWYVRQERDGFILGPYESNASVWSVDGVPAEFGADLLPPDLDRVEPIIQAALERIPSLGDAGIKSVVNGPITFTPDANPLIGPVHGVENAWLLTGSSMGVMEGGGAGWFLARWMTDGYPPMDAQAVDSRRFGSWADRDYRVKKAVECFGLQFGVHYPFEERPAARNKKLSPLHDVMVEHGAVMGVVNGWERPNWFGPVSQTESGSTQTDQLTFKRPVWFNCVAAEVKTLSESAALGDLSVLSKFTVEGEDTLAFLDALGANRVPSVGRVGLTHALTEGGGVHSEFTVSVIQACFAYLTAPSAAERICLDYLLALAKRYAVTVRNVSDQKACIGIMGPQSRDILSPLTDVDLQHDFPWLHARQLKIADIEVIALRVSYVGELGYELHVENAFAPALLTALQQAGQHYGLGYYGAYAANSMRLEKGYIAWSTELTTERTPEESAGGRFVSTGGREFAGRDALIDRRGDSAWRTVLAEILIDPSEAQNIQPFYGHPVLSHGQTRGVVGVITSAAYGYRCGQFLAFALLREHKHTDSLSVEILGTRFALKVLNTVPVDPDNKRLTV